MKIFLAEGRLGNQIFQYMFLRTISRLNENLIVSGFDGFFEVFEVKGVIRVGTNKITKKIIYKILKPCLSGLARFKIISSVSIINEVICDVYERESLAYARTKGLLNKITLVKSGYFQSESFFDNKYAKTLKIKNKHIIQASNIIKIIPEDKILVYVHVRRGDYVSLKIYGRNTLLPIEYFHQKIKWFLEHKNNYYFIFLSDDFNFVKNEFGYLNNKLISHNQHYGVDLAIMTMCTNAILSPSSFGWWGSYLMSNRQIIFAPKYWLGFQSEIDHPSSPLPSYVTPVNILYGLIK